MDSWEQLGGRLLVVFDGGCGFCNFWVRWLVRHDKKDRFRVAPSASPRMAGLLARHGFDLLEATSREGTVLLFRNPPLQEDSILQRSDAVVAILAELPGLYPVLSTVLGGMPCQLRDWMYQQIACHRHLFAGKVENCPLPSAKERSHFLD